MKQRYEHHVFETTDLVDVINEIADREICGWEVVSVQYTAYELDYEDDMLYTRYSIPWHVLVMKRPFSEEANE